MKDLNKFDINFARLKESYHIFNYEINNNFFNFFNYDEFNSSFINVTVKFIKENGLFNLTFISKGYVETRCDVSNELYKQEVEGVLPLIVKFDSEYNDEDDKILILPYNAHKLNVAQYIYEMIVLSVPHKRLHPKVIDGTMEL